MKLEDIDLNLLLSLHWLLEEASVTKAARRRGVTQPAMSRSLRELRHMFQDELLVRSGRTMVRTPAAEKLKPDIAEAMVHFRRIAETRKAFDPKTSALTFSVACSDVLVPPVLAAWRSTIEPDSPNIDLRILLPDQSTPQSLASHHLDLVMLPAVALRNIPKTLNTDNLVQRVAFTDRFCVIGRRDHPQGHKSLSLARFAELAHVLVSPTGSGPGVIDTMLKEVGLERRVRFRVPSGLHALSLVQQTDSVAVLPASFVKSSHVQLKTFETEFSMRSYDVLTGWMPGRTHDDAHRWIRERLLSTLSDQTSD